MALDCTLDATREADVVTLALTVRNAGDEAVDLTFPTAQRVEATVRDGDDQRWRYSDDRMFAQVVETDRLGPDESTTYAVEWPLDDVAPGEYAVTVSLTADADGEASTTVSVDTTPADEGD